MLLIAKSRNAYRVDRLHLSGMLSNLVWTSLNSVMHVSCPHENPQCLSRVTGIICPACMMANHVEGPIGIVNVLQPSGALVVVMTVRKSGCWNRCVLSIDI